MYSSNRTLKSTSLYADSESEPSIDTENANKMLRERIYHHSNHVKSKTSCFPRPVVMSHQNKMYILYKWAQPPAWWPTTAFITFHKSACISQKCICYNINYRNILYEAQMCDENLLLMASSLVWVHGPSGMPHFPEKTTPTHYSGLKTCSTNVDKPL